MKRWLILASERCQTSGRKSIRTVSFEIPSQSCRPAGCYSSVFWNSAYDAIKVISISPLNVQADSQSQGGASTSQAAPVRLTLAAKEDTLASLVADKWLSRREDGRVALGIKSFVELRSLFKNFEVPFCDVCNEAAIKVLFLRL